MQLRLLRPSHTVTNSRPKVAILRLEAAYFLLIHAEERLSVSLSDKDDGQRTRVDEVIVLCNVA